MVFFRPGVPGLRHLGGIPVHVAPVRVYGNHGPNVLSTGDNFLNLNTSILYCILAELCCESGSWVSGFCIQIQKLRTSAGSLTVTLCHLCKQIIISYTELPVHMCCLLSHKHDFMAYWDSAQTVQLRNTDTGST
jgi:hypothetical protein